MSCATWQWFIQQFRNTWYCGSLSHPHPSKERRSAKVRKENLRTLKNSKKIPESRKIPTNLNESQKKPQNSENPKTSFFLILESVKSQIRFFSLGSTELLKFSVSPLVFPHTIFLRGFCYSYSSKFFCYKMFRKFPPTKAIFQKISPPTWEHITKVLDLWPRPNFSVSVSPCLELGTSLLLTNTIRFQHKYLF